MKWKAKLGWSSLSTPVVANGLVWIGSNNGQPRDPKQTNDAGVLMCFRESDGQFLYQHVSPARPGHLYQQAITGITGSPLVEGGRLWFVNTLAEVICLDIGPLQRGEGQPTEVWKLDLMGEGFGVYPRPAIMGVQGTNLIFAKGFGEGITAQTPFKLASVSKSFTAVAIMQLVEAGKLNLESPVHRYLPWFRTADEAESGKITLRHLLHHISGISTRDGLLEPKGKPGTKVVGLVRSYCHLVLTGAPGGRFEYSNANYNILGAVVEAVSGVEFDEYIRTRIFDPLQMNRSYASCSEARRHGLLGHRYWFGFPIRYLGNDEDVGDTPAGGLISSAEDLAHYTTALLNGGRYRGKGILSSNGVEPLFRNYGENRGQPTV